MYEIFMQMHHTRHYFPKILKLVIDGIGCNQIFSLIIILIVVAHLGESPVPSVSSGASSPLCTSTVTPALIQAKPSSSNQQDRKVPPPIGTERLARIRQTGSVNHTMLPTSYTPPVGQGGIWSFGVGSASGEFAADINV